MAVDDAEFRELFASEYARLCWLGFLLTGSRAEGEELAQETLVRIWWRWRLGRRPADPARYARRVLVNRQRSLLRRAAVEARSLGRARPAVVVPPADSERAMVLWEAVQALPPRQRAVLVLRYKEDLTEPRPPASSGCPWARSSRPATAPWPGCASGSAPTTSTRPPAPPRRADEPRVRAP